ncbi:DUF551 domain-containing protein [Burkholderia anthina]|uniref:DUF551 domain-containing protein n=1 Tax=Burkholderia anthina TaxID=179879 RepID=UPI0015886B14|nr:DUF551 domain-containing protein [Burkholderia anthina]
MTASKSRADAPTEIAQFLTDVVTAAGLLSYGRTDKKLATRITEQAYELRKHMHRLAASPVDQHEAAPCTCSGLGPCETHTDGSCHLQRNSASAPADERAAYSLSAIEPGFEAAWPSIHRVGFDHGWRGVALAAWRSAYEYARAARMQAGESQAPSGYAHRYPHMGGTVIRFNNGGEVNGSRPTEAIPYWFDIAPKWVSVSDRLPARGTWVLAHNGKWIGSAAHFPDNEVRERWQDEHREFIELLGPAVTHWMPMPAAPVGGSDAHA